MDNKNDIQKNEQTGSKKNKAPSKKERDKRRMEKFLMSKQSKNSDDKSTQADIEEEKVATGIDPQEIYKNFELNLMLTKIEDRKNLSMCLRHAIRHIRGVERCYSLMWRQKIAYC